LSRIAGRINLRLLADRFVIIIGVGWVGSALALELAARCGIGRLGLVDGDRLEPPNLTRHVLTERYLWMNKAEGMRLFLTDVPSLDVAAVSRHVDETFTDLELDRLLAAADVIVIATDRRDVQRRVAERALALDIPAVIPGLYADRGGEVFVQLGPAHPCFLCWDAFRPADAEVRAATALGADSLAVIQRAVLLSLGVLDPRSAEAREFAPPPNDRRLRQLFIQRQAANLMRVPMTRRDGCPACAVGPSELNQAQRSRRDSRATDWIRSARSSSTDWSFPFTHRHEPPTIDSVTVSDSLVPEGTIVRLTWAASNATHVEIDGVGGHPARGEMDVLVSETRFFRVTAVNPFGRASIASPEIRVMSLPRWQGVTLPTFPLGAQTPFDTFQTGPGIVRWTAEEVQWPMLELPSTPLSWSSPPSGPSAFGPSPPRGTPVIPTPPMARRRPTRRSRGGPR
jgi:molybdopterin/thiamine biosynthesis adenylyltransferase